MPPIQARNGLCQLPVFRPVALKMLHLLASEQTEVRGISSLLQTDPALSAEVLAVANSSFYGTQHHVEDLNRAVLVLGFERTRSVTLTMALKSFTRHPANAVVMHSCWQHSLASALLAEELAHLYEISNGRAYTAGLIHDVGRLGLLRAYGERYAPLFSARFENMTDCLESERSLFEMDHCQAGLILTQRWGFPSEYSRVAGCHHGSMPNAKQDLVSITQTACQLADAMGFASMTVTETPAVAAIGAALPSNPWQPYTLREDVLRARIARQMASVEVN